MPHASAPAALLKAAFAAHTAGHWAAAEAGYRRLLAQDAQHVDAHYNLALILQATHRLDEAQAHYRAAIERDPRAAHAWNNLGNLLRDTRRWSEARVAFERAIALRPDHPHARMNLALALLSAGHYAEAWPLHESRLTAHAILPALRTARWQGEDLAGRSLLLVCEQGFGDTVQFIRYAPLLKARGAARVSVLCRSAIAPLLASCEGVDRLVAADDGQDELHVPLHSLAMHFGTVPGNIPAGKPYLHAPPAQVSKWQGRLPGGLPRIGLAWRGNPAHANDANRSLPLAMLAPLWNVQGACFVSLQKGSGEEEARSPPPAMPLVPAGEAIEDFADLAALVSLMDLVVCVDTAVAHVAGAMGRPCWLLLPATGCDWRWFNGSDPSRTPWYPEGMRLFHQPAHGQWAPLVHGLAAPLQELVRPLRT